MWRSTPVLFLAVQACAAAAGPTNAPSSAAAGPVQPAIAPGAEAVTESGWGRLRVVSRALELELPNSRGWRYRPGKTRESWVRLAHAASDSALELWTARAERLVLPRDCEARARLGRPDLFVPTLETRVSREALTLASGVRGELAIDVTPEGGDASGIVGELLFFGAAPLRCLAVHYTTRVRGEGAADEVARRLDVIARRVLPSIGLTSVEARVPAPAER